MSILLVSMAMLLSLASFQEEVPYDLIEQIDSKWLYQLDVLEVNLNGKIQEIYILGESHQKGTNNAKLAKELLSYFSIRAVEFYPKASESGYKKFKPKSIDNENALHNSTIFEAMNEAYFIWDEDYVYFNFERVHDEITDTLYARAYNIEQTDGLWSLFKECGASEPLIYCRNKKMVNNLKLLVEKYPDQERFLVIVGLLHIRGVRNRIERW